MVKQYKSLVKGLYNYFIITNTLLTRNDMRAIKEIELCNKRLQNLIEKLNGKIEIIYTSDVSEYNNKLIDVFKNNFNNLSSANGKYSDKVTYTFINLR